MEIDWQNVVFDFDAEANCFTTFEQEEHHFSNQQQNIQVQSVKRTRKEMEEEVIIYQVSEPEKHENIFVNNTDFQIEEEFQNQENVIMSQQNYQTTQHNFIQGEFFEVPQTNLQLPQHNLQLPQHNPQLPQQNIQVLQQNLQMMLKNESGDAIYACSACTLDFPSIAYLKRHQNTKKHIRALKMEQRGRKVNQKRKYVRKNGVKPANSQFETIADNLQVNSITTDNFQDLNSITDLTPEEIELLNMIDNQVKYFESEKSAKDFYENFMDNENVEPKAKVQKLSTIEEIMEDLLVHTVQNRKQLVQIPQNSQVQDQRVPFFTEEKKSKIQCEMCPKTFNLRCHFTQHMNIVHTGNRNFKCQKCGKKYPQQELLDIHMEKHIGNKPFKCSKCEKSYNTKFDLKRHEQTHNKVKDHICIVCGGGFVRYDHLEKHLSIHKEFLKNKRL